MSTPTQIWQNPQNGKTFCFVSVPREALSIRERTGMFGNSFLWSAMPVGRPDWQEDLPPGTWQLLGKGDELTEAAARGVMPDCDEYGFYINYLTNDEYWCLNAVESLHSLIRSLGFEPAEVVILEKIK